MFLQLHDAMIVDPTESPLDRGILNEKFNGVLTELAADASSMGSQIRPDDLKPAADGFYFSFLNRLLFAIHEQHHGGTLLFLQPANVDKDLRTKYQTKHIEIWNILLRSLVDFKHITQLRAEAKDQGLAKEKYSSFTTLFSNVLSIDRNLQEQSLLLAALANVDGALLLDFQFRILGFGAEILAREEFQFDVHMSLDPDAKSTTSQPIDMYGTRHRSTFRFLRENPGSVAFIISQDGSVKGACSDGEKRVIYWTNLEMFFKLF
ncbi:MAG: hypothetical protein JNM27_15455 [Leptospirales bacterium]|nr:hypothetical protein [Leptospirales bacterium]